MNQVGDKTNYFLTIAMVNFVVTVNRDITNLFMLLSRQHALFVAITYLNVKGTIYIHSITHINVQAKVY